MARPVVWIDFEDIFLLLDSRARPSGIQRLAFEAAREMVAIAPPGQVRVVRHSRDPSGFREVAFALAEAAFARSAADGQGRARILRGQGKGLAQARPLPSLRLRRFWRGLGGWLPAELRLAIQKVLLAQFQTFVAVPGVFAALVRAVRGRKPAAAAAAEAAETRPAEPAPGDVLLALAAPWSTDHVARAMASRARGVRYATLFYDLIPVVRPEFCVVSHIERFEAWMQAVLPACDLPMAISHATRRDVETYAARHAIALPAPVAVVRIGTSFAGEDGAAAGEPLLPPGSYVLFVSTIEARKNHTLLFRVWRRLLEEMPPGQVPTLVFAGGIGWMVDDLLQQFANSRYLDGHLVIVEHPSDAELAGLYRGAMFTVYPSHYEGWGLPVVESLALGTPCVAARATSLPESGGALARYFESDNVGDAVRVIRGLLDDPAALARWRDEVRCAFRPVAWRETAREILAAIGGGAVGTSAMDGPSAAG